MKKPLLVLFDGHALVHRAFHALPPLTVRRTGELVGAVFGFAQILLKVLNDLQPTYYAIAFDRKAKTFRHEMFDQYKATRKETPQELSGQFGRVRELVNALKMPIYEIDGFEADDVLGTLSGQAARQDVDTVIVTGDADTMQLVSDKVRVFYPRPRGNFSDADLFDNQAVVGKFGVPPEHVADFKSLKGDPSDNIPGVPGIGEKTAVKLISQFGSLDEIYKHLDEVTPEKLRNLLRDHEAEARQSLKLATIVRDVPLTLDLHAAEVTNYDRAAVVNLLQELEFSSLLNKLPQSFNTEIETVTATTKPPLEKHYSIVSTAEDLDKLVKRLNTADAFVFKIMADGPDPMLAGLVGIAVSPAAGESYYIPVAHAGLSAISQLPLEEIAGKMLPVFAGSKALKAHNGKFDMTVLAEHGMSVTGMQFDSMIA
ncbi:MAG TPA: 5'-3' exonuclease H3TH domain-containing protein, partial [Dehalococcoidales bacterium]|nr:5'-3' exonuclease H3TH domain-containing protein [Dehalococcoidales bacterium]